LVGIRPPNISPLIGRPRRTSSCADDHDRWLDLEADPADVLKPCPSDWLEAYPADKRVGNVRNNDPGLIEPLSG
jgi:putative SOS response-associated peptidase YedK